jgi:hypothetical protein
VIGSTSPSGRFEISLSEKEAFNSCWVFTPTLTDRETGAVLFKFQNDNWSLDEANWLDDTRVAMTVRKYPGNHQPNDLVAIIDCMARSAEVGGEIVGSLDELESRLEALLHWIFATPTVETEENSVLARLRGFFRDRS